MSGVVGVGDVGGVVGAGVGYFLGRPRFFWGDSLPAIGSISEPLLATFSAFSSPYVLVCVSILLSILMWIFSTRKLAIGWTRGWVGDWCGALG